MFQASKRVLRFAMTDRGGSDHEAAVHDGFGDALVLLRLGQQGRGADGGARLAKCYFIRVHDPQAREAEVAHGASRRAEVERIARRDQYNAQIAELRWLKQTTFYDFNVGR